MSLRARLVVVLLALMLAALLPLGAWLSWRVQNFAREQARRTIAGQLAFIARDGENVQTDGVQTGGIQDPSYTLSLLQYELFGLAVQRGTWGLIITPTQALYSDDAPHPRLPPGVRAAVLLSGAGQWGDVVLARSGARVIGLALREDEVRALARGVVLAYALGALGALAGAALLGAWLLQVGLRPLRRMTLQARQLGADSLQSRLPLPKSRDEVRSLSESLNGMLDRLQDAFSRLEREEERTRQFVADASHELRTPLAAISGSLDVFDRLGDSPDNAAARERLLTNLRREARRANRLVNDLLTLGRLDAGEPLARAPLDLAALLGEVAATAADLAPQLHFEVEVETGAGNVRADRGRLEGAVWNLLRNAVAASPEGATVILRAARRTNETVLSVLNPAVLPEAFLARMFDRFVSGEARGEGSGLGLAIVRATARAHGGEAFARNTSQGLEVGFTLPDATEPERTFSAPST